MIKDKMINNLHILFRNDPWIEALFNSTGISYDQLSDALESVRNEFFFDTMVAMVPIYEKLLQISVDPKSSSLEERRAVIEGKFKSGGQKCTLKLIQSIAKSFSTFVDVDFLDGKIKLVFDAVEPPPNLDILLSTIDNVKPAHLAMIHTLKKLIVSTVDTMINSSLNKVLVKEFQFYILVKEIDDIKNDNLEKITLDGFIPNIRK